MALSTYAEVLDFEMNQPKRSVQTRLKTTVPVDASSASPGANPKNSMEDLFSEIRKLGETLNQVATDVTVIRADTTELKNSVCALQTRMDEAETRISNVEDSAANMVNDNMRLTERVDKLWQRIENYENQSRRNNVRLVGLKEGKEAGSNMNDYVRKILRDGFKLDGEEFEIERSHRNGGPRPDDNAAPRIILVKFLRYTAREKALAAAKKIKGLKWEGCTISMFEDLTKERSDRRRLFSPIMKILWQHQVKHTLAHPATLRFTWKGKRWSFTDPEKAECFIRDNITTVEQED